MEAPDAVVEQLIEAGHPFTVRDVVSRTGVSRQAVHRRLRKLVDSGELVVEGAGPATFYVPNRRIRLSSALARLDEDTVWQRLERTSVLRGLGEAAEEISRYAVTELVNNCIDHSGGTEVVLSAGWRDGALEIEIRDDGVGVWRTVAEAAGVGSDLEALEALSKGKLTRAPDRHTGEGIFFTSKAVQQFRLASGALEWVVDNEREDQAICAIDPIRGTRATVRVHPNPPSRLVEVFEAYTEDFAFVRTRAVVKLFEYGTSFVSRSEARRLVLGLEKFNEVIVDFRGVRMVGQGFADELFRVWHRAHPDIALVPVNMKDEVAFMVRRAR